MAEPPACRTTDRRRAALRAVRLGAADAIVERQADGTLLMRVGTAACRLSRPAGRGAGEMGEGPARARLPGAARRQRRLAHAQLRASARPGRAHRRRAVAARAVAGAADRHPLRQFDRARAAGARRHACRHSLCADLAGLFADVERLRQAAHDHGAADARAWSSPPMGRPSAAPSPPRCRQDAELVVTRNPPADRKATPFAELIGPEDAAGVAAAQRRAHARHHRQVPVHLRLDRQPEGGDQHPPHAVLQPGHVRRPASCFVTDEPPVVVDWLPWSHTFGSNHNFNLVLVNGGSLYIDDGNPTPPGAPKTARNLREIAPTIYFNVPKGYEALVPHLRADETLRKNFFSPAEGDVLCRRRPQPGHLGRSHAARRRDHRRAHYISDRRSARPKPRRRRSPAPGSSTAPAISACRSPASS